MRARLLLLALVLGALVAGWRLLAGGPPPLVVYCAHDAVHARAILEEFERTSGVRLAVRWDTEATKSLGLVELLRREQDRPRCDVFWNNELLGTAALAAEGLLEPYRGPGWSRIPAGFKDAEGRWTGFAARARVWIVNTRRMAASEAAVERALAGGGGRRGGPYPPRHTGGDLSRVALARPLYGTTLTHYTVLWRLWGPERTKAWHAGWRRRGVQEVPGNARVKDLVAAGACDLGLTDTDDCFEAADAGKPVAMLPVRPDGRRAIVIPNTVAVVRGTARTADARRLVDYLLSERTELALARGAARQVPLGPVPADRLPGPVREIAGWAAAAVPLADLLADREACLAWLRGEGAR